MTKGIKLNYVNFDMEEDYISAVLQLQGGFVLHCSCWKNKLGLCDFPKYFRFFVSLFSPIHTGIGPDSAARSDPISTRFYVRIFTFFFFSHTTMSLSIFGCILKNKPSPTPSVGTPLSAASAAHGHPTSNIDVQETESEGVKISPSGPFVLLAHLGSGYAK
ncbi:hypothetical protein K438DRAFT_1774328 [Mycena galopus ATCC 62051]|nr:hypothetical protein K438DRAFT_1774328 [Mycena galopus ATCC 62051]